jgi:carbon-monoxide dehydrogenase small subunit
MRLLLAGHAFNRARVIAVGQVFTRAEIREFISGNMCRCTGYEAIVDAIESALRTGGAAGEGVR